MTKPFSEKAENIHERVQTEKIRVLFINRF